MKMYKLVLTVLLSGFSFSIFAQNPINVEVIPRSINNDQLVFLVIIPQTNLKDVEKDWHKYVGKKSKGKAIQENGVHLQYGATNDNISSEPFEVYSKLLETNKGVHLRVWLMQNNAAFISEDPNSGLDLAVRKYVSDFAVDQYRNAVQQELKAEEHKQKDLEKELARLIKDQERSMKRINKNERSKEITTDEIATNDRDIDQASYKIYDQKEMVEGTSSDRNANKGAKKTLDDLEDEKKDLQKENNKQEQNIDDWDKENREEERNITDTEQKIVWKTADVEMQKQKVHEVKTKLEKIR